MDGAERPLPYQIPGPAGGPGWDAAAPSGVGRLAGASVKDTRDRRFYSAPWQAMLKHLGVHPCGDSKLDSSVALLRSYALGGRFDKVPRLAVRLDDLSYVAKDASVMLSDPTGSICATIHAEVFASHKNQIEAGSVLVLKHVAALAYYERRSAGFRLNAEASLHVSIQPSNIELLCPISNDPVPHSTLLVSPPPLQTSYAPLALSPPVLATRMTPRRARSTSLPVRRPLHPRPASAARTQTDQRFGSSNGIMQPGIHSQHRPNVSNSVSHKNISQGNAQHPSHKRRNPGHNHWQPQPPPQRSKYQRSVPPSPPRPTSSSVVNLTEDQLDNLLGDVDIDAVIAARIPTQTRASSSSPVKRATTPSVGSQKKGDTMENIPEFSVPDSDLEPDALTALTSHRPAVPSDTCVPAAPTAMPAAVDDAMINDLLQGLDSSDFA